MHVCAPYSTTNKAFIDIRLHPSASNGSRVAVAQSSSGGVAICYVLPLLMDDVKFGRNGPGGSTGYGW